MKPGTSASRMPAKVFVAERASVTAGLANEVDDVNQYAAVIYAPTAKGTLPARSLTHPQITESKPNVARNSLNIWVLPARAWWDRKNKGSPNIPFAAPT